MGRSVFNLSEELDISYKIIKDGTIEVNCFILSCIFVFILWMSNIITITQFVLLNIFYIFWILCVSINNNTFDVLKINLKKKMNTIQNMLINKKID